MFFFNSFKYKETMFVYQGFNHVNWGQDLIKTSATQR